MRRVLATEAHRWLTSNCNGRRGVRDVRGRSLPGCCAPCCAMPRPRGRSRRPNRQLSRLAYRIRLRHAGHPFASLVEYLSAMTKLADCGGRHVAHRYAQNAFGDVVGFSLAKTASASMIAFATSSAMRLMSSLRFADPSSNLGIAGCSRTLSARLSIAVFVLSKNPLCRNSRF